MVRFVDRPYASEAVRSKISSIKWKMACGIGMTNVHFITLSDNKSDLFDIYPAPVFKQKKLRKIDLVILGIADNHNSAVGLIEQMIRECLKEDSDLSDVRGYFERYIKDHL